MSDDNNEQQKYLRLFKSNFFLRDLLGAVQRDLKDIKETTNLEEKYRKTTIAYSKHRSNEGIITSYYNNGKL
jgi:hypothetical protein